jgi:hypothetical protein
MDLNELTDMQAPDIDVQRERIILAASLGRDEARL